ncbi:glycosyltransferase family 2 protein [Lentiprolixibacter aurantiacus]|uniref:Glycosyltransferase family 2 protein n=1 Tax=Lentiprolixibacter aurantiacus TaxID=2993939 RepID=A0AAE3MLW5_9FLAO|nr:glycosyltransferase family 2 protein [Lentiprolixibacter aurantiacus]MCX2719854.1 glycosyltransferase family 2 protein [Lentiprolixibacter aurantiacus]
MVNKNLGHNNSDYPLVSVNVVTYNSSATIVETLESIKAQSYPRIELIVSDDCSEDNTLAICQKWIDLNKSNFENAVIITSPFNTGISKNCNRALNTANGDWIKPIAGDDTLKSSSIKKYIEFINKHPEAALIYSNMDHYINEFRSENKMPSRPNQKENALYFSKLPIKYQIEVLARIVIIGAPSIFFNRQKVCNAGGFNEISRYMEDLPSYYTWLEHGLKFYYLNESTVNYRLHQNSISNKKDSEQMSFSNQPLRVESVIRQLCYPHYSKIEKLFYNIEMAFFHFYIKKTPKSYFGLGLRKLWYTLTVKSVSIRRKSIKRYYMKYMKEN